MTSFGPYSQMPATANPADEYQCTDCPVRSYFDGTKWNALGWGGIPITPPVQNSAFAGLPWSWVNQDTAQQNVQGAFLQIKTGKKQGANFNILETPVPPAPYKATAILLASLTGAGDDVGLNWRLSTTGKSLTWTLKDGLLQSWSMDSPTAWHGFNIGGEYFAYMFPLILRLQDDGGWLHFSWGCTPYDFDDVPIVSTGRTNDYIGGPPDRLGFYADCDNNDYPVVVTLCSLAFDTSPVTPHP